MGETDNDGILKSQENSRQKISPGLRNHNQWQNRHVKCKVIPTSIDAEGLQGNKTREASEVAHNRINHKVIRVSPSVDSAFKF